MDKQPFLLCPTQGCRDGVPDERGGAALPGPGQEAVGGGLPVRDHPGPAVGPGVRAGGAGTGGLWRPDRLGGSHRQGLHLQHARYVSRVTPNALLSSSFQHAL